MAIETTTSAIIKFLWAPLLAIAGWLMKAKISAMESALKEAQERLDMLQKDVDKNYFDRAELKEFIVDPLTDKLNQMEAEVKLQSGMVNEIHAIIKYKILGEELKNE